MPGSHGNLKALFQFKDFNIFKKPFLKGYAMYALRMINGVWTAIRNDYLIPAVLSPGSYYNRREHMDRCEGEV